MISTFLITGANRGIGFELTRQVLEQGSSVIAGVRRSNLSAELSRLEASETKRLKIIDLDVTSDRSVSDFVMKVQSYLETSGKTGIDVLINNAGIYLESDQAKKLTATGPGEDMLKTLDTNAVGPARVTQSLLPLLRRAVQPRVANISSLMGSIGDNSTGGSFAYRMSKAALNMYGKTLALAEPELVVLTLHPGWVQTAMGGPSAPLQAQQSATGLLKVINGSGRHESGRFYDYAGKELPW